MTLKRSTVADSQVRQIVQEEMILYLLEEGLWDDVKAGAIKLRKLVTKQFGQQAPKWGQTIQNKLSKFEMPDDVKLGIAALKAGMKESGESIELDDALKAAKELGKYNKEKALALTQADLEGPVHEFAKKIQQKGVQAEARYFSQIYKALFDCPTDHENLNEVDLVGAFGIGLAVLGGLPMLFKGLEKIAHAVHAERLTKFFTAAEHVTHAFEVKTINAVVPDKLSYAAYKFLHSRGLKFSKETKDLLEFGEFLYDEDGSHAKKQVNGLLYKSLLLYFAFNGLAGVLHAGASLVGFVEGTATAVKGVELARGATELAALIGKSA